MAAPATVKCAESKEAAHFRKNVLENALMKNPDVPASKKIKFVLSEAQSYFQQKATWPEVKKIATEAIIAQTRTISRFEYLVDAMINYESISSDSAFKKDMMDIEQTFSRELGKRINSMATAVTVSFISGNSTKQELDGFIKLRNALDEGGYFGSFGLRNPELIRDIDKAIKMLSGAQDTGQMRTDNIPEIKHGFTEDGHGLRLFEARQLTSSDKIAEFLASHTSSMDEMCSMAEWTNLIVSIGIKDDDAIRIASNPNMIKIFDYMKQYGLEYLNRFIEFNAGDFLWILEGFGAEKQEKLAELAIMVDSNSSVNLLRTFYGIAQIERRLYRSPIADDACILDRVNWDMEFVRRTINAAGKNAEHVTPFLDKIYDHRKDTSFMSLFRSFKGSEHYAAALYGCKGVQEQKTLKGKAAEIQSRIDVFKEFGFEYVERLDPELLEHFYKVATGKAEELDSEGRPRKLAIIVLNKDDQNGAFCGEQKLYHSLIDQGYNLIFCEAGKDTEVAERFFNHGRLASTPIFSQGMEIKKYDLLILGGHGSPYGIQFGRSNDEASRIDLQDYTKLKEYGDWEGMFTERAAILLWSCSTGGKLEEKVKSDFSNIMTMISDLSIQTTFAPILPISKGSNKTIEFDSDGYVVDTKYDYGDSIMSDLFLKAGNAARPMKRSEKK